MSRKQEQPKVPAAIQYLRDLHSQPASPALRMTLDSFNAIHPPQSHDAFLRGVQEFTRIANLNYQERIPFFGNSFCGVHYNNDLTARWNALHQSEKICAYQLNLTAPHGWNYECVGGKNILVYLVYKGNDPARALDRLLQGPTVIDCGMFCQLSIWFGIRSALGNEKFNQLFGHTPFYITQLFYNGIDDPLKPYLGNPLFDFFERVTATQTMAQSVSIAHVANHPEYQLKHPGGNYQGENCIEIDGQLTIFDPALSEKSLTKTQIAKLLCDTFNAPQNERDQDKIAYYQKLDQSEAHSELGFTYGQLIHLATTLANTTINESDFDFPVVDKISFDFDRFMAWAQRRLQRDFSRCASYQPLSDSKLLRIVTPEAYQAYARELGGVEFVPGFDNTLLAEIRFNLQKHGALGSNYNALTVIQKKWLYQFVSHEMPNKTSTNEIAIKRFEQSSSDVIAVELLRKPKDWRGWEVNDDCVAQLLRVINYAFDRGGKKIIIVNATGFTQQELISQIKMQIDKRDKERTIARLDQLFYSSELLVERTPVELPRSTPGAFICDPKTVAQMFLATLPMSELSVGLWGVRNKRVIRQQASPNGAPQCFVQ